MTTLIPVELAEARAVRELAWAAYGIAIDLAEPHDVTENLGNIAEECDATCQAWYDRWQVLGGTSDIRSIIDEETKWITNALNEIYPIDATLMTSGEQTEQAYMAAQQNDPRTAEQRDLDEWQAEAEETQFGTAEWYKRIDPIPF